MTALAVPRNATKGKMLDLRKGGVLMVVERLILKRTIV